MKRTLYKIIMSNGQRLDIEEQSAAVAIQTALTRKPGATVKTCYAGMEGKGIIHFEIPAHRALTEAEAAARPKRAKDTTLLMFSEAEMASRKP